MNNLKYGILILGVAGLAACFIPDHGMSFFDMREIPAAMGGGYNTYLILAGYALGTLMGLLAVVKPPLERWHSATAAVGFAFVIVKFRTQIGEVVRHGLVGARVMIAAAILGAVVSLLAMFTPETAR